ncbi:retrovirus-related pol polyprotein from transposon TNT 1-94 [Tanacetum coccineum]
MESGLEVGLIRRIQGIRYGVLGGFLGVRTTFDIFQNIHILYLEYGVFTSSGYGVLSFIPLWSLVSAGTDTSSINHEKYTLVIVDEYSRYTWVYFLKKKSQAPETIMSFIKRVENQNDIKVKQLRTNNVYIHNHKDHLGKFDEKANDGYLLGYSLVSKAFRVFNTRRQQTEETYPITFDESPEAIKFSKPSVDNINIAESERYTLDEYLHPYEPS